MKYRNEPKYWDSLALANSVDLNQTPQNTTSDQGLHRFQLVHHENIPI